MSNAVSLLAVRPRPDRLRGDLAGQPEAVVSDARRRTGEGPSASGRVAALGDAASRRWPALHTFAGVLPDA